MDEDFGRGGLPKGLPGDGCSLLGSNSVQVYESPLGMMVSLGSVFPGSSVGSIQDDEIFYIGPTVPMGGDSRCGSC